MKLSLRAIDNVLCLVNSTSPCLGQLISEEIPMSKFLKEPVLHSKRMQVYSKALGQDERLISSSRFLLTCPGCSSCEECAYAFTLYRNRQNKRKSNISDVPYKKCNQRFLDRESLEEKTVIQKRAQRV